MPLTLTEQFALLAFNHDAGMAYDRAGSALPPGLAATLVLDLRAVGSVELDDVLTVTATATAPVDPLLLSAWRSISTDPEPRPLRFWMARPARLVAGVQAAVYERLVERGVLADEGRTRIFRRERYAELDGRPHETLVAGLAAVLDGRAPSDDELLLLALLPPARLTSAVFPHRDARATDAAIKQLVARDSDAADVSRQVSGAVARQVAAAVTAGVGGAAAGG